MRILAGNINLNDGTQFTTQFEDCGMTPEGEETFTFDLPMGFTFHSQLESNNSTTVRVYDNANQEVLLWNSGTFITCAILGGGVGLMVGTFARNAKVGFLAEQLAKKGCTSVVNRTYEDGDTYVPPC